VDRADPRKYNTANNLNDQIISNEYFPNYGTLISILHPVSSKSSDESSYWNIPRNWSNTLYHYHFEPDVSEEIRP